MNLRYRNIVLAHHYGGALLVSPHGGAGMRDFFPSLEGENSWPVTSPISLWRMTGCEPKRMFARDLYYYDSLEPETNIQMLKG